MPTPKHDKFCPQCGCVAVTARDEYETFFQCGERVTRYPFTKPKQADTFTTSYSCKLVPQLMRSYEAVIASAQKVLDTLQVTQHQLALMSQVAQATKAVQLMQPRQKSYAKRLIDYGFLFRPYPEQADVFGITDWGRMALTIYEKERAGKPQ